MLAYHPLAKLFPMMSPAERAETRESMKVNGQRKLIVLLDDMILDGRNRYEICLELGLTPRIRPYDPRPAPAGDGPDPLTFVEDENLRRRQLSASQRASVAADVESWRHGGARRAAPDADQDAILQLEPPETRADLAERYGVSERTIADAAKVRDHGTDELRGALKDGSIPAHLAAQVADLKPEIQAELLTVLRDQQGKLTPEARKRLAPLIKEVRADKQKEKGEKRDAREAELGRRLQAEPEKVYGVVLEDFEWDHEPWSRESGMDRHPSNHYPTAADAHTPEEIVARTAERFKSAADTCVLYMWTTIPHEKIAHRVMELRGFDYKSQRVWDKVRPGKGRGPGYWVTGEHEILLIGTRGPVVAPKTAHFPSRFEAPVGRHSEKPEQQYEHAEFHFPNLPKIELNARRARPGWKAWGFEAPAATDDVGTSLELSIEYPEEASGTAREAPSTGCGTADESQTVGIQSAPPPLQEIVASCCTHFASPRDGLDIPAFLRRAS